jgi:hypothetical protein
MERMITTFCTSCKKTVRVELSADGTANCLCREDLQVHFPMGPELSRSVYDLDDMRNICKVGNCRLVGYEPRGTYILVQALGPVCDFCRIFIKQGVGSEMVSCYSRDESGFPLPYEPIRTVQFVGDPSAYGAD